MPVTGFAICGRPPLGGTLVALGVVLSACSGSGAGLNSAGQPISGGSGPVPLGPTFEAIQQNVFTPICSVCHIGATAPEGLRLDASNSYNLLVNVASTEVPSLDRIKPGDPANSYLIQKIEGHAAVGGQMPLGETPLPASTISFIVQWVTDGAQNNTAAMGAALATEFRVAAVAPESDDLLSAPPPQIVLGFTRDLDATRVSAVAVRLEHLGTAGAAKPIETVPVRLTVPAGNPRALIMTPNVPLSAGQYRVLLTDASGAGISALDGEHLAGPPPDANGDRLITRFTVAEVAASP